jgi:hypothetical protein
MRFRGIQLLWCALFLTVAPGSLFAQRQVAIRGYPVEGIDYDPLPAIFTVVTRGALQEASVTITNRRSVPLKLVDVVNPSRRFTARVETLEKGKRFRLVVTLKGEGPVGKQQDLVELKTNLEDAPVLRIPVNTDVRERVYTFPDSVFMGRYGISEIRGDPATAKRRAQILMVYRKGASGLDIQVRSDVPFLRIESERGPNGDRWENTIWLDPEGAKPGEIHGKIFIQTNDPEVPKLEVPVTGKLLDG